jgi:hypothetical protein
MELLTCVGEVGALKFHVLENTHARDVQGEYVHSQAGCVCVTQNNNAFTSTNCRCLQEVGAPTYSGLKPATTTTCPTSCAWVTVMCAGPADANDGSS